MVVSPMWHGKGNILASFWMNNPTGKDGLLLEHQIKSAVSRVRIIRLTFSACGRWDLVADEGEAARRSS